MQIINFVTSKTSPDHNTAPSMFHSGNDTCRTHAFTFAASHKHSAVWAKYFKFRLVCPQHWFPLFRCPVFCVFWPVQVFSSYLLVLGVVFLVAILPFKPASRRRLWTVDVETSELLVVFSSACNSGAVSRRFRRLVMQINLSSDLDVTLGLPDLFLSSWVPVSLKRLIVLATAVTDRCNFLAICHNEWPSFLKVITDCLFALLICAVFIILQQNHNQECQCKCILSQFYSL